jgi:hypothetical protein
MPDWKKLVREGVRKYLEACDLPSATREDVIVELAAHLEETYAEARSEGLTEAAAIELTLQEVEDWVVLSKEIFEAKMEDEQMNTRTKSLWLPGMATLLGSSLFLMVLQRTAFQPRLVWIGHATMLFYWPWLAGLPLFGALGAYLSQRAHGSIRARLAAGLSPSLELLAAMCVFLVSGLAVDGFSMFRLFYFVLAIANWVILPACALLLGG